MHRRTFLAVAAVAPRLRAAARRTEVAIRGDEFLINGRPTYAGRSWQGRNIQGLLMNVRAVQAIFDDLNPATRSRWAYPDTGKWDPERNTREFIAALPEWRSHGVLAFTVNLQGGSPQGYSQEQPWENSAIDPSGGLRPAYMARLERVLDRADELGMVAIVGYFYFGQDQRVRGEAAVRGAVVNATNWLLDRDYRNVLVEVNNECNVRYDHETLQPARVHELIDLVKSIGRGGRRLLAGTSYGGGTPAADNVVKASDFLLLHGNGPDDPGRIRRMIERSRANPSWRPIPVLINEDDHFRFDQPDCHMLTAVSERVSWGYFDPGQSDYSDGYQCPPVNWGLNTERKRQFFSKCREVTGATSEIAVIAHRGEHLRHRENTLPAFQAAIDAGADFFELDVRTTSDGKLVLMHDGSVDRTTNGHGAVSAMTYEELRRLGVPSFEEALELARGKIGVYIDAKSISAQDLVTAVAKYGLDDRVVIYGGLALHREIRKLNPRIRVMPEAGSVESVRRVVDELHPQVIAFDARDFQDDVIAIAKAAGAELYVDRLGPADNPQSWEDAVRRGASGIQTDHPAELVELLRSRGWHR